MQKNMRIKSNIQLWKYSWLHSYKISPCTIIMGHYGVDLNMDSALSVCYAMHKWNLFDINLPNLNEILKHKLFENRSYITTASMHVLKSELHNYVYDMSCVESITRPVLLRQMVVSMVPIVLDVIDNLTLTTLSNDTLVVTYRLPEHAVSWH